MADKDFKIEFGLFSDDPDDPFFGATLIDRQVFDRSVTVRAGEVLSLNPYPVVLTETALDEEIGGEG